VAGGGCGDVIANDVVVVVVVNVVNVRIKYAETKSVQGRLRRRRRRGVEILEVFLTAKSKIAMYGMYHAGYVDRLLDGRKMEVMCCIPSVQTKPNQTNPNQSKPNQTKNTDSQCRWVVGRVCIVDLLG
jgi:hypothetical protein